MSNCFTPDCYNPPTQDFHFVREIDGWCSPEKAARIYELGLQVRPFISVELGVFAGRSLIALALAHRQNNYGFALGFDAYKSSVCAEGSNAEANNKWWNEKVDLIKIYHGCIDAIEKYGISDYCSIVKLKSQTASLLFPDERIDIIHQDSNHNTETILKELELWIPKLKKGGYWIADDTDWIESQEGYSKLPEYGLTLVENHIKWQIWQKQGK